MTNFKPMGVHLSIKKDELKTTNEYGLDIPDPLSRTQRTGTIINVPLKDATNEHMFDGDSFCNLNEGDRIIFMEHAGVHYEGTYFLNIKDVLAKFD